MYEDVTHKVRSTLNDDSAVLVEKVQRLWSDYGAILRYRIPNQGRNIIVKVIDPPKEISHPRGWANDFSAQRKMRSYRIERYFYQHVAVNDDLCKTAECYTDEESADGTILLLEDLDASGYHIRPNQPSYEQIKSMLSWLAYFHARYLSVSTDGLWQRGSYWHLATRPDELKAMPNGDLKQFAQQIDDALEKAPIQTLIHGDAKLANFCFAEDHRVAAVDFQYVGGGIGTVDVMYLLGSCLDDDALHRCADSFIDQYFDYLGHACSHYNVSFPFAKIEACWRYLLPFAWADFQRFLEGWSPGHWKVNAYTKSQCNIALARLRK